jgi:type II secretory pathway pseudopilin PulG
MYDCLRLKAGRREREFDQSANVLGKFVLLEAASELTRPRRLVHAVSSRVNKWKTNQPADAKDCADYVVTATDNREETGFTLLEALVALVLFSMVVAIVFGSLGQVLDARSRLRPHLDQAEETALVASWFRQTVQALLADYETGKDRFAATADGFSGLTASPLIGPPGTPTAFHWLLKYDAGSNVTILEYAERPSNTIRVASWSARGIAFSYFGQEQEWYSIWPPADLEQSKGTPQLPTLIRLGGFASDLYPTIVAAPRSSAVPRTVPPNFLSGTYSQN